MTNDGFIVIFDDQGGMIQPLQLNTSEGMPKGGILDWVEEIVCVFNSRAEARAAIIRTHHYAKAFGVVDLPLGSLCKIWRVERFEKETQPDE